MEGFFFRICFFRLASFGVLYCRIEGTLLQVRETGSIGSKQLIKLFTNVNNNNNTLLFCSQTLDELQNTKWAKIDWWLWSCPSPYRSLCSIAILVFAAHDERAAHLACLGMLWVRLVAVRRVFVEWDVVVGHAPLPYRS